MIRERLELHFDTLPEQSGQRSRLCGTVLSGLGVSRREPGCPGRAPGFLRRPLVFGLRVSVRRKTFFVRLLALWFFGTTVRAVDAREAGHSV